jgi:hypothetical protein
MPSPSVVDFGPIAFGPFELSRLPASGAMQAAALLASVAIATRRARARALPTHLVLETHVLAVPVAIVLAHAAALWQALPAALHDARMLAAVLLSPPMALMAVFGVAAVALAMAWACGRPLELLDALAPGACLLVGSLLLDLGAGRTVPSVLVALAAVTGAILASRRRWGPVTPGLSAVLAGESLVVAAAATQWQRDVPSLPLVACAAVLGGLVLLHVTLHVRAGAEPREKSA